MSNPWAFGWTQLLTIIGFAITGSIAIFGFRSFNRWRREKLEEKRIEVALEAMAMAFESKYVFLAIRSPMSHPYEWKDMPKLEGETEREREKRGPYYAILARVDRNKDFFERLYKLQPRFLAMFGAEKEEVFMKAHTARRFIEVSAGMLMRDGNGQQNLNENAQRQRNQWEADIWDGMDQAYENADRVSKRLKEFQDDILNFCRPITAHKTKEKWSKLLGSCFFWRQ